MDDEVVSARGEFTDAGSFDEADAALADYAGNWIAAWKRAWDLKKLLW